MNVIFFVWRQRLVVCGDTRIISHSSASVKNFFRFHCWSIFLISVSSSIGHPSEN
jgi:hypothetical protein